jgi:sec-independent protein translocase protein TatB
MGAPLKIELANLGMADTLIVMVIALVVLGPRRLPQIGRQIGRLMYEFRKASNDFKFQMEEELRAAEEADRRKKEEERQRELALKAPAPEPAPPAVSQGSPYREDVVYPPSSPAAEAGSSEPVPVIQPPSTGEPIAAARPGAHSADSMAAPSQNGTHPETAESDATRERVQDGSEHSQPPTEQAAPHG